MKVILIISLLFSTGSCHTMKIEAPVNCIQKYIDSNKNTANWPVSSVDEYEFQGKLVYAFNPPRNYADASTFIKASDCKDLCSVGGFAGRRTIE